MTVAIRVVIVDDEPLARRGIRQLLAPHPDVDVVGEARNGKEAVRMLQTLTPDLVFLDVQMPELDGFAVLRQLDSAQLPAVIFVTAHDAFAVKAFETHACDYLVKPVHEARFQQSLARARGRVRSREAAALTRRLLDVLGSGSPAATTEGAPPPARRIIVSSNGSRIVIDVADIEWIEADDYYAAIFVRGRRHLLRESLASLESRLDPIQFARVHRSAIVNLSHIREVRSLPAGDTAVVLRDGTQLPLSRRRREQVADALRRFAG